VIERHEQRRAIRAVERPHATLKVSVVSGGGKVSLIRIVGLGCHQRPTRSVRL
jgi:hypothetical protein